MKSLSEFSSRFNLYWVASRCEVFRAAMTAITLESDSGHGPPVIGIATGVPVQKSF